MALYGTDHEIWKPACGYEGYYEVSSLGRIKSLPRNGTISSSKILKEHLVNGYNCPMLQKNGVKKFEKVHRLVAKAFIPNPYNLPVVNHKDGNRSNNAVENLEWCTYSENSQHGLWVLGKNLRAVEQRSKDGALIKVWRSIKEAADELGLDRPSITNCCIGRDGRKTVGGYRFNYVKGEK